MFQCSSASRKFLNHPDTRTARAPSAFQCSSASRKFLNLARSATTFTTSISFSALQRAENSSTDGVTYPASLPALRFSALQRAENSSTIRERIAKPVPLRFQCSSASRKFLNCGGRLNLSRIKSVSVLFSEPKIPQYVVRRRGRV